MQCTCSPVRYPWREGTYILLYQILSLIRGLGEDVANLRFEVGVDSSAAQTKVVLVVLRMLEVTLKS